MSTIGDILKRYISEQDKQSALASRWLELWRARFPKRKDWSPNTVESNLSRLLKSDPQGIRFFFEDDARSALIFEVLGVPTDQQVSIQALADSARQPGPRVVVDISAWPTRGEALTQLFAELRQRLPQNSPLQPVAIILTDLQYEQLPRSYDEQLAQRALIVRKVGGPTEGPRVAAELAGDSALVLAPWEFLPHERWLAADFTNNTLSIEPPDGLETFAEHGSLPSIPAIEHPLERICESAPVTFKELSPRQRRWWRYTLASEARTTAALAQNDGLRDPSHRLAFAKQIGATATSTARERLDHELAQLSAQIHAELGFPVEVLDPVAHAERIARAELRPIPMSAWRCADEIHLLHADPPVAHPCIIVHHPVPVLPALTRLVDHVSTWSVEDFEADPMLAHAVETLDPEGRERAAFLHARGTFLWNDLRAAPPAATSCVRWADELRAVFAADPPPASLRIRLQKPANDLLHDYLAFADDSRVCASLKALPRSLAWPRTRRTLLAQRGRGVLQIHGRASYSRGPWALDKSAEGSVQLRDSRGRTSQIFADPENVPSYHHYSAEIPELWLPKLSSLTGDVDLWLDCLERSSALGHWKWEHSDACEKLLRTTGVSKLDMIEVSEIESTKIEIDAGTWMAADNLLAQCWIAFRTALERPLSVSIGTGVVCSLGAGICAHLVVLQRHHGPPRGSVAAFDASVTARRGVDASVAELDFTPLWTHSAVVDNRFANFGVRVPSRLVLRTPTISASITFLASPLLQANTPAMIGTIASMVAAQIADEEEEERAAYDDD